MLTDIFVLGTSGFVGGAVVEAAREAGLSVGAWARTEAQAFRLRQRGVPVTSPPEIPAARVVIDLIQPRLPDRLSDATLGEAARLSALFATGFALRFPSIATGLPASLARLEAA
jgi:nucleoside-diphosphate-sugar epimerase